MSVKVIMPPLSQTMDTLVLLGWSKKLGDSVEKGETLFTVETDKASLEVESPGTGTLYEVMAEPNSEVKVGSVIGTILEPGENPPTKSEVGSEQPLDANIIVESKRTESKEDFKSKLSETRLFASPRARRLVRQSHLDLAQISPTGPRRMVVERDVLNFQKLSSKPSQAVSQFDQGIELTNIRKTIAHRMRESLAKTAPVTYMNTADATNLVAQREKVIAGLEPNDVKPTFTDFFIRILCLVLKVHPDLNSNFDGEKLTRFSVVHMSIAVDTERGLIVPVLHNANDLNILQIANERKRLVERALGNACTLEELSGGTFTISNLGTLGIDYFTPIINPPQVAILAVGQIHQAPVVHDGQLCIRQTVGLAMTCDHRIVDGAPAARFLKDICNLVENPDIILL